MEYVTESLTVSGKWRTIFVDKMKVKDGIGNAIHAGVKLSL